MGFDILIYSLFILAGILTVFGLFFPSYYEWIVRTNKTLKIFTKQVDFSKISFIFKERKFIYLLFNGFSLVIYLIFTFMLLFLFWWFISLSENYNWKLALPLLIIDLLFQVIFVLVLWKLWKKISLKTASKVEAVNNFIEFKKDWTKTNILNLVDFRIEILSSQARNRHNFAFQYHQKKLINAISKLNKRNLIPDIFNYKLLQIFISYLKNNAWQIWYLKNQFIKYQIWIGDQQIELEEFKTVLINNFFSVKTTI